MSIRIGIGYDIHRLGKGKGVRLGGVLIPSDKELVGHSDADVLIHAVCDALLGAIGEGDMGIYFPDTDPEFRKKESSWFLKQVVQKVRKRGFKVLQIDSVVVAQTPRLLEYRQQMKANLSKVLEVPQEEVSIKAKTNEALDAIGNKKAIAAWVVVLIEKKS